MSTTDATSTPVQSSSGPGFNQPSPKTGSSYGAAPTTTSLGNPIGPNTSHPPPPATDPSQPPPSPAQLTVTRATPNTNEPSDIQRWRKLFENSCWGIVVVAPVVALLPPRKLDPFTFALGGSWFMAFGYALQERTGKGLMWHIGSRIPSEGNRHRIEEEKRHKREEEEGQPMLGQDGRNRGGLAQQAGTEMSERKKRGLIKRLWMGGESDNWVEERAEREKEALESGEGYSGLIMDQIREAFGGKKASDQEGDEDGKS